MTFMDDHFMLKGEASKKLYEQVKDLPIFDFHCHLSPQEIYEDKPFNNIVEVWLGGDHYKWRLMRANGVPEEKITGNASDEEKFQAWAETLGTAFGNPLYHFTHLEMKNFFGIEEPLTAKNWKEMYDRLNATIKDTKMSPRQLIKKSNVAYIGTTDDPLSDLEWHKKLIADETFETKIAPTFRPDGAFVTNAGFKEFVEALSEKTGRTIDGFNSFVEALDDRATYFQENGCRATDISLDGVVYEPASTEELDAIFNKTLQGESLTQKEIDQWQTEIMMSLCGVYKAHGFVTLIHFGALRNNNERYYKALGGDMGFDSIGDQTNLAENLNAFLNALQERDKMPKMGWYNINPEYNTVVANTIANFQANQEGVAGRLQFGAAWWFADTKEGMTAQMTTLAQQGLLSKFNGMLTDSRSFLSYGRHDYFRRLLCSILGTWIDEEEIPNDMELVGGVAKDIAFYNANRFFLGEE